LSARQAVKEPFFNKTQQQTRKLDSFSSN